jgi:hypothetical protein
MTVSISLDHRQDLSRRAETPADLQQVVADGGKINLDVSRTVAKHGKTFQEKGAEAFPFSMMPPCE